ncbi:hypothetical protein TrVE_jg7198 [Triparma verrucosa]|uniref:Malonyl-CoA decarboxylase n=1 Tax=Triparma verrucosa TaxID=1606542 RepID=A0A9W7F3G3_9STRA|nr:hypothetical protein TrVE_jg7198 [Triparma verrucosa]
MFRSARHLQALQPLQPLLLRTTSTLHTPAITKTLTSLLSDNDPSHTHKSKVQLSRDFTHIYTKILSDDEKLSTLRYLCDNYGADTSSLSALIAKTATSTTAALSQKSAAVIRKLSTPRYEALFSRILTDVPNGMETIVSIRSDLRRLDRKAELKQLNQDLHQQLSQWFSSGILELRRITFDHTPAAIIEKIAKQESVHPVQSLDDLCARLGGGMRCFGFFHPSLPDEPLVFVHVALMPSLTSSMEQIAEHRSSGDSDGSKENDAKAAIFYSINSTKDGLAGVELGNFLIKRVAATLQREFPNITTYSTLSPIPRFRKWLLAKASLTDEFGFENEMEVFGTLAARDAFLSILALDPPPRDATQALINVLEDSTSPWHEDVQKAAVLKPILTKLAARYIAVEKKRKRPVDGVAKFHMNNGAELFRVNFAADLTRKGLAQSYGLMVNYRYYDSKIIEKNHSAYANGVLILSDEIQELIQK